jgi:type VI secretion system protein ImpJ
MNFSKPIYWRQGIFLQPQHFQYNDAYQAQSIARVLQLNPNHAGAISSIKFVNDRLQSGFLACSQLQAFMPDGQWVDIRLNARLADADIRNILSQDGVYKVAIGLPKLTDGSPAVADKGLDGRFEAATYSEQLADLYDDNPELEIDRLWFRLRFLVGDEIDSAQGMNILSVAKLVVQAGTASFDEAYAPACLTVESHPALSTIVHQFFESMQAFESRLAAMSKPWRMNGDTIESVWLRDRMVHAELAQCLTQTGHRLRMHASPSDIFECFLVLARRLSAVGGVSCPELPLWERNDPCRLFDRVGQVVLALLDQLRSGPDNVVVFQPRDGWLEATVPSAANVGGHVVYLVVQQVTEMQLLEASSAKLASLTRIETVVSRALAGIPLERLDRVPYGVAEAANAGVWKVDTLDPIWKEASSSGTVCLHWLGLPKTMRALLVFFRT